MYFQSLDISPFLLFGLCKLDLINVLNLQIGIFFLILKLIPNLFENLNFTQVF